MIRKGSGDQTLSQRTAITHLLQQIYEFPDEDSFADEATFSNLLKLTKFAISVSPDSANRPELPAVITQGLVNLLGRYDSFQQSVFEVFLLMAKSPVSVGKLVDDLACILLGMNI